MKIRELKYIGSWLIIGFIVQPGWSQDDFLGGPAVPAEADAAAQDAQPEDFEGFDLFNNQAPEPTEEETAEVNRLVASGKVKQEQGDLDGALDDFEQANLIIANFASYLEIGRILREQGDAVTAIANLNRAVQLVRNLLPEEYNAGATAVLKEIGLAYLDSQEFNDAIQAFRQAQLVPGQRRNAELIFNQGLAQAEFALNQQYSTSQTRADDLRAAIELYDRAIEIDPNYAEALYERGNSHFLLNELDEAYDDLQQAVKLDPTNAETVAQLGFVSLRRGLTESQSRDGQRAQIIADLSVAVEQFTEFLKLVPAEPTEEEEEELEVSRENVLLSRSAAFLGLGEESLDNGAAYYRRGVADADEALELVPELPDAHFQRGMAFRMLGDLEQSLDAFTAALELNPGNTEVLLRRGIVYFRQGDYQLAKSDFTRAIRYSSGANPRAHFWLGLNYAKQGDSKKAINEYDLALRYQPFFTLAHLNRGIALMKVGRFQRAVLDFNQVLRRERDNALAQSLRKQAMELVNALKLPMVLAVSFENVAKQYRLGEIGTGTISRDLERMWAKLRGKPDPYALVGETTDRGSRGGEHIWALNDISFGVERGEVFGVVGRNGAGKSTLLKILSRVTAPTAGRIRARGRIASLLEVGTGFHQELTGRDNIFLNGALLGMTHREIQKRLAEIVEFSGCAKYLDTPVKRYSSGMTVRLGFAVAAHLECEIMVIDEVLAVGDAAFQKQCIDRLGKLADDGRTILFVSHNMQAVEQLCTRACVIEQGKLGHIGGVNEAVQKYLLSFANETFDETSFTGNQKMRRGFGTARIAGLDFQNEFGNRQTDFEQGEKVRLVFSIKQFEPIDKFRFFVKFSSGITGEEITSIDHNLSTSQTRAALESNLTVEIDTNHLRPGIYPLYIWLGDPDNPSICYDCVDNATKPLLITRNGSTRGDGIFDVDARIVSVKQIRNTSV